MINKVILLGRLGRDPVIRKLDNQRIVANLSLATSESYLKNGQRMESTEWHNLEMWDQQAQFAEKYLRKGSVLYVEGKIRTDKYVDTDGIERQARKIRVISYQLLDHYISSNSHGSADAKSFAEQRSNMEQMGGTSEDMKNSDYERSGDVE
jgi:single-strand DNA-binding protein